MRRVGGEEQQGVLLARGELAVHERECVRMRAALILPRGDHLTRTERGYIWLVPQRARTESAPWVRGTGTRGACRRSRERAHVRRLESHEQLRLHHELRPVALVKEARADKNEDSAVPVGRESTLRQLGQRPAPSHGQAAAEGCLRLVRCGARRPGALAHGAHGRIGEPAQAPLVAASRLESRGCRRWRGHTARRCLRWSARRFRLRWQLRRTHRESPDHLVLGDDGRA